MKLLRAECDTTGTCCQSTGSGRFAEAASRYYVAKCNVCFGPKLYQCQNGVLLIGSSHAIAFRRDFPWNFLLNF